MLLPLLLGGLCLALNIAAQYNEWQLVEAAARYKTAQSSGNLAGIRQLFDNTEYHENGKAINVNSSILSKALVIDKSRTQYDYPGCVTWTELIVADAKDPHVIGTQITVSQMDGAIKKIDTIHTKPGDWLFNATNTLYWAKQEKWDTLYADQLDTRESLQKAADAYLDLFGNSKVIVPWGSPCDRLEGGAYTGNGSATDSCNVGVPSGLNMTNRRYVIDESCGTVDVMLNFGTSGWPDSHEFRIEKGKIRYVHTMTVCGIANCGINMTKPGRL